jgi:nicotinamidase-related amidase
MVPPSVDLTCERTLHISGHHSAQYNPGVNGTSLPIPPHFDAHHVDAVWRVPYEEIARAAPIWREQHAIPPASGDEPRILLIAVDMQNTFCIPGFELFVAGRDGRGAVDDVRRLCEFIYCNLGDITSIALTMDTHHAFQIFHPAFWVDQSGNHPAPYTLIFVEDVAAGRWQVNPEVAAVLHRDLDWLRRDALHYVDALARGGKYELTIWPYHAMMGGIGHAIVPALEEAAFFHGLVRGTQPTFQVKGNNPLTENYSVLQPEVLDGPDGEPLAHRNAAFVQELLSYDVVILAGEAKSHCLAWTIHDLLTEIRAQDPSLVQKVYLLEDCASPVVVPGVIDYTEQADAAFAEFAAAGMHVVRSTDPMSSWPDMAVAASPASGTTARE